MRAYKGFHQGFVCRGYRFDPEGVNRTDAANCVKNGFHCAENPLDVLSYYPDVRESVYCLVDAGGDIDEDNVDSKISCTELRIVRVLTVEELLMEGLAYAAMHRREKTDTRIAKDVVDACGRGYAMVCGKRPAARGKMGDVLALGLTGEDGEIFYIDAFRVDGVRIMPDTWYGADREAAEWMKG